MGAGGVIGQTNKECRENASRRNGRLRLLLKEFVPRAHVRPSPASTTPRCCAAPARKSMLKQSCHRRGRTSRADNRPPTVLTARVPDPSLGPSTAGIICVPRNAPFFLCLSLPPDSPTLGDLA